MSGAWQKLLRKLSPRRRFEHEYRVAELTTAFLQPILASSAKTCGFSYQAVPIGNEIHLLIGFLSSIHDVYAQSLGAEGGGPASINGTMKTYQSLFGDANTEALMAKTFDLYSQPDQEFEQGRFYGTKFMNALLQGDTNTSSLITVGVFGEHYKRYCD
jgi:hypothetical protein